MSAGLSSDQIVKNEIIEELGFNKGKIELRIFPEGSNDDQRLFQEGGLTLGIMVLNMVHVMRHGI